MTKMDDQKIEIFLKRGVENIFPSKEFLKEKLLEGKILKMYLGIDPTGPSLHLGHIPPLLKLKQFQDLGHKVILLIGDFTATIGDPTGKDKTRQVLSHKEVLENSKKYKDQASKIISFEGENSAEIQFNSEWLSKLNFEEVLKGLSNLTVDQMLKRDMFQKRQKEGNPIFIHEFLYPFMQGIDSVFLDIDGEVGGNDQTFNMLVGRDLMKTIKQKEKFVVAVKLLTDPTGKKMGKTEGNMVSLDKGPDDIYGGIMSFTDDLIIPALELLTLEDEETIKEYEKQLKKGDNPKKIKSILASRVTELIYNNNEAIKAEENFKNIFSEGGMPDNPKELIVTKNELLSDVLIKNEIIESKAEFKRLINQGGIKKAETLELVEDFNYIPGGGDIIKIGKKQFVKIVIK